MKAWNDQLDPARQTGVCLHSFTSSMANIPQFRFLGDPTAEFTKALNLSFDGSAIFGGIRSKRYVLLVKKGKVAGAYVEPDNTGTDGKDLPHLQLSVQHG